MKPSEIRVLLEMKYQVRDAQGNWVDKEEPDYVPDANRVKKLEAEFLNLLKDSDGLIRYDVWVNFLDPEKSEVISKMLKAKKLYRVEFRADKAQYSGWIKGYATADVFKKKRVGYYTVREDK